MSRLASYAWFTSTWLSAGRKVAHDSSLLLNTACFPLETSLVRECMALRWPALTQRARGAGA